MPHSFPGYFCKTRVGESVNSHWGNYLETGLKGEGRDFSVIGLVFFFFVSVGECLCPYSLAYQHY